jgi:hypothetical protein
VARLECAAHCCTVRPIHSQQTQHNNTRAGHTGNEQIERGERAGLGCGHDPLCAASLHAGSPQEERDVAAAAGCDALQCNSATPCIVPHLSWRAITASLAQPVIRYRSAVGNGADLVPSGVCVCFVSCVCSALCRVLPCVSIVSFLNLRIECVAVHVVLHCLLHFRRPRVGVLPPFVRALARRRVGVCVRFSALAKLMVCGARAAGWPSVHWCACTLFACTCFRVSTS